MKKEIRAFIRILKEIGIYRLYINCRKEYLSDRDIIYTRKNIFAFNYSKISFSEIIDRNLSWYATDCEDLWVRLYDETQGMKCTEIAKSDYKINCMKKIVKDELNI